MRAIDYLERALAIGPPAWNVHYSLATAYRETGETAKADEHLNQSGGDPPEPPDPLMTAYENLLRSPRAYGNRGAAAMREGRPAEAVSIFREGLAEAPDDSDLRRQLGDALLATGDTRGAGEQPSATSPTTWRPGLASLTRIAPSGGLTRRRRKPHGRSR